MKRLKPSPPAKFFFAIHVPHPEFRPEVEHRIIERYGPLDDRSEIYLFSDFSTYYDREFGNRTWKYFISLQKNRKPEDLVEVKLFTEDLEASTARRSPDSSNRTVNLDPGYVNGWQVVLGTVKNHSHRICLGRGVFAEVTLIYRKGAFRSLRWTYPDYASQPALDFLRRIRERYLESC